MSGTPALPVGAVLAGRFEVQSTLGRGGFSITYVATDLTQHDECVIKELAPAGAQRAGNELDLSTVPSTNPARLRKRFLEEANLISGLVAPGILHLRDAFEENGTAYFVTDMLPGARTLDSVIAQEGRMGSEEAQDILFQLVDILEGVHERKILHRDLKPSNILLSPKGEVFVIDFGAAREWHADSAALQTVLFTPGYAPLEQLSDRGRRGPATDIYALCATAYHMLAGFPPRPASERADGTEIAPLGRLRPDLDQPLTQAVMTGLELHFKDRPQSIAELRALLVTPDPNEPALSTLETYDATALRLKRFSFDRNQCPVCSGILERPKPLRAGICPLCREGAIRPRDLPERRCAKCRTGVLHHRGHKTPILICPICFQGVLKWRRGGLSLRKVRAECPRCSAVLEGDGIEARLLPDGEPKPWASWLVESGRSREAWICDSCEQAFDIMPGGRWKKVSKHGGQGPEHYPDEWARIAAGLKPDAGNAHCDFCQADYWSDEETLTLLAFHDDPYRFGARYLEQKLSKADVPWIGAGKSSGNRGPVCPQCDTEFDEEGAYLTLVQSPSVRLSKAVGRSLVMEDWHRLAQGLPLISEQESYLADGEKAMRKAFENGEIPFELKSEAILWSSQAKELERRNAEWFEIGSGQLTVTAKEIAFGRLLRKWRAPVSGIISVALDGGVVALGVSGEPEPIYFEPGAAEIRVTLQSGDQFLRVGAEELAAVLRRLLGVGLGRG